MPPFPDHQHNVESLCEHVTIRNRSYAGKN